MTENQEIALGLLALALTAASAFLLGFVRGSVQLHNALLSGSLHNDESSYLASQHQFPASRTSVSAENSPMKTKNRVINVAVAGHGEHPILSEQMSGPCILLTNWMIVCRPSKPWSPLESYFQCLTGHAQNHPRHQSGKTVTTSAIKARRGEMVLTASGSLYQLGQAHSDYENRFPNARQRLLAALPEDTSSSPRQFLNGIAPASENLADDH